MPLLLFLKHVNQFCRLRLSPLLVIFLCIFNGIGTHGYTKFSKFTLNTLRRPKLIFFLHSARRNLYQYKLFIYSSLQSIILI
jgi:hypothetical protein